MGTNKIETISWVFVLGLQCAVIEFARHVLDYKDANSAEFDKCEHQVVVIEVRLIKSLIIFCCLGY